ncbi:UNVERIFIED_CONTAM: Xyloglucan galactosyltransferase MUR3 [Sesamum angustifolium]|uniref:Xyloglucan galactosyltransferase MUR3 n=1 Tax=Sesamum angustifolium TaxID=2727405 RepID=A0AAW2IYU1_9LAMI
MRRRQAAVLTFGEIMEKGQGKSQISCLCLLALLSSFIWICLLYFHFMVLGGRTVPDTSPELNLVPIEASSMNSLPLDSNPSPISHSVTVHRPEVDVGLQRGRVVDNASKDKIKNPVKPRERVSTYASIDKIPDQVKPRERVAGDASKDKIPTPVKPSNVKPPRLGKKNKDKQNYPFMRALRTVDNKSDPCGGRYIYVHNLPPRFNEDMLKECKSLSMWTNMCKFTTNAGLGPPLENVEGVFSDTGWYATNQFAVDVIFGNRMKQYECLTNDSSLAAAIFVPFYAGFDIARYLWGYNVSTRDAASLALVDWLMKRPEWRIMGGKDHFLVGGRITWDFRRLTDQESDWGNKLLFLPAARNMSMLVVESSPWHGNDFGIPYPTYFHPAKDAEVFAWQNRMRKLERKYLFCFAGAPRPGNRKSIRGQIIDQCKNSKVCKLLECDFGESKCHSPSSIMQMFQSSLFCLQPPGDSFTRRSAFDSMLAGCIPVFFHPGSAYAQYTWHLPKNYSQYSVLIAEDDIRRNVSIEQQLKTFSAEKVMEMREAVINLIPRVIYADPRSKLETLKDAFDIAVQAVINKVTKLRKDMVEGRKDDFIEELSWKYALLEEGQYIGPHEWDPFFAKRNKDGEPDTDSSSAEAAKNSWKSEQRQHS